MKLLVLVALLIPAIGMAQVKNESELGVVIVSGNADSNTTNVKQTSTYTWEKNALTGKATYTETEANTTTTAKTWDALARYDRALKDNLGVFASYLWESNFFAGYVQRETAELGLSYSILTTDTFKWRAEFGYSGRDTNPVGIEDSVKSSGLLAGTTIEKVIREGVSAAFWAKYRHDLEDQDPHTPNHTIDFEPSLSVILNSIFSLKLAYLVKSQARTASAEHTDTTFTTNLVAKF